MNYADLILFIDKFVDRKSISTYSAGPADGLGAAQNEAQPTRMLRRNIKLRGTLAMTTSLTDIIDRFAMTFGQLAMLAALPVAAIALAVHAL
ncbi:MAG TPA: hypothetical protein VKT30_09465 [Caulobacteraceae bacterium]|nr:hypothetical protein [Caulobacteraceae bacterium]